MVWERRILRMGSLDDRIVGIENVIGERKELERNQLFD